MSLKSELMKKKYIYACQKENSPRSANCIVFTRILIFSHAKKVLTFGEVASFDCDETNACYESIQNRLDHDKLGDGIHPTAMRVCW